MWLESWPLTHVNFGIGHLMTGVNEIRSAFLDYFAREGHEVVPSSPLVPRNDRCV